MKLNFQISDFNISGKPIPQEISDKILKWHIIPMQRTRDALNIAMWPSQKSGYRSVAWEKAHGRSGNSQHVFRGMGATDWTCQNFSSNKDAFLNAIMEHTDYTRMAVYNSFIHCDYKPTKSGQRELYSSDAKSNWKFTTFV